MSSSTAPEKPVRFEDVMLLIGGIGRWQLLIASWMTLSFLAIGYGLISAVFLGETPNHLCADGHPGNVTFESLSEAGAERCLAPDGQPCRRWTYDPIFSGSSVVTQWDLVCARKPLLSAVQSVLMLGGLFGSLSAGALADRLGRRAIHLAMLAVFASGALLCALPGPFWIFLVARFVMGLGLSASASNNHVLMMELTGVRWRVWLGQMMALPIPLGEMLLAGMAYNFRIWWQLQLTMAAPMLLFVLSFWLVPESPRWLILNGRDEEALRVVTTAARINGRPLPEETRLCKLLRDVRLAELADGGSSGESAQLWRSPRLRRWMIATCYCWVIFSGAYYSLSFDVTQLSENPYLAGALSGLVGVPGYFSPPLVNYFGRRPFMFVSFLSAAVCMLIILADDDATLWLVAGLVAKFFVNCTYSLMFIYTPEYIPTSVRALGLGIALVWSRIGAMVAPFIVDLASDIHPAAPSVVFGCACLLASLAVLMLPETAGRPLPETAAEVEAGVLDKPERDDGGGGDAEKAAENTQTPSDHTQTPANLAQTPPQGFLNGGYT